MMPLVDMKNMLLHAYNNGYAVAELICTYE